MENIITCQKNQAGNHNFFIKHKGKEYYLFSQPYHRGVNIYFANGVSLNNVLNYRTAKGDHKVIKTMSKMKMYIKYVENEYELKILNSTIYKGNCRKKRPTYDHYDDFGDYSYKDMF